MKSRVRLVKASDEEKRARDLLTHAEWGQRLTVAQFLEREERLRAHPWAREAMITWLWVHEDPPAFPLPPGEGQGEGAGAPALEPRPIVLGSCETFRMQSVLRVDGREELGDAYGVASVFVEPRIRGQRIATEMMTALVKALRNEPGRPHSTILFSDVGAPLYERAGYVAAPGDDRVWAPLAGGRIAEGVDRVFGEADLAEELARTPPPSDPSYVVWPTAGQLDWHIERERIYADLLGARRPAVHGARRGESVVFWAGDLKHSALMIELLVAKTAGDAVALLRAARRAAHDAGLREVRHWSQPTDPTWPANEDGGRVEQRDGSLSMLAPLDARVDPRTWRVIPRVLWI